MRRTAKKSPKRPRAKSGGQRQVVKLLHVTGRLERGKVYLSQPVAWSDGQRVVVIPIPRSSSALAPPVELLDEDAVEFARRPETMAAVNRSELE